MIAMSIANKPDVLMNEHNRIGCDSSITNYRFIKRSSKKT